VPWNQVLAGCPGFLFFICDARPRRRQAADRTKYSHAGRGQSAFPEDTLSFSRDRCDDDMRQR
jgi:hypothetical protein